MKKEVWAGTNGHTTPSCSCPVPVPPPREPHAGPIPAQAAVGPWAPELWAPSRTPHAEEYITRAPPDSPRLLPFRFPPCEPAKCARGKEAEPALRLLSPLREREGGKREGERKKKILGLPPRSSPRLPADSSHPMPHASGVSNPPAAAAAAASSSSRNGKGAARPVG